MSCNMVSIVHASKGEEADNSQCDEEIILEGPNKDRSRINSTTTPLILPLKLVRIEMTSIQDVGVDLDENEEKE